MANIIVLCPPVVLQHYIMHRPYRQTAAHPHLQQHVEKHYSRSQRDKSQDKSPPKSTLTLAALFQQHASHTKNIHIKCNKKINVVVEKAPIRRPSLLSERKRKRKVGIVIGGGSRVTLQACLQKFASNINDEYILTHPSHNYEEFSTYPRGKAISIKSRSSSQTSLTSYSSNKKQPQNYPLSNPHIPANQSGRKLPHQFSSEKGGDGGDKMFIVEENPGQSLQSERESLPRQPMGHLPPFNFQNIIKQNIKEGVNNITAEYIQKAPTNQGQGQGSVKAHLRLPQNKKECKEEKENHGEKGNHIPVPFSTNKIENTKFSFAEAAMRGLFTNEPVPPSKQQLFPLVPIQPSSQQKKELLPSKGFSSMSGLSSIAASNIKQAKHMNFLEIDSIRNQLEKINTPLTLPIISKPSKIAEDAPEPFIEIKLNNVQEKSGDIVQIEEKALQQNRSQYFVRYNLKQKRGATDVIRISPLKFRKKEEVVRQFVKARIVSKQSDSINIP